MFYSYGISDDWTFDSQMAKDWGCKGFLLDPTINHPSVLQPGNLTFYYRGAPLLGVAGNNDVSPVDLRHELGHTRVDVVKMDCEGCEYALVQNMRVSDPSFLGRVDQLILEVHISRKWISSPTHLRNLGLLYHLLFQEGFNLLHADLTHCAPDDEATGCPQELIKIGYPCYAHCHNYLFARPKRIEGKPLS